ncbi:MAG: hypothetical protein PHE17_21280 [Thiothrix sp.]|uniref:hypothetical protein n=1 Tax=Thiothrix sp. TaxID=1032 RepID=UPI00261B666D|nr:hypothetical protein [Thiothrix sp.]MDD5395564.1 hypothetical protein [Thiothrix sp.]
MKIRMVIISLGLLMVSVSAYCSEMPKLEDLANTRYGLISVAEGEYVEGYIYINKKKSPFGDMYIGLEDKWEIGTKDVLLISSGGRGTSCGAIYHFLIIENKQAAFSASFGNCSVPEVTKIGETILVKFPRMNRYNPAETAQYENGKVTGMVNHSGMVNGKWVDRPKKLEELKLKKVAF